MNRDYLPYFNSLNEKEKTFWLDCSKEELIDHFIANVKNGEKLLLRIDKAIEYIKENACYGIQEKCCLDDLNYDECDELLEILGDKENE